MTPQDKVVVLLRTLSEALVGYGSPGSDGMGAGWPLPAIYTMHSYDELERCLGVMRDGPERKLWWHLNNRFRWGVVKLGKVTVVRRDKNPRYVPPIHAEIIAVGEHYGNWARARLYVWSERVDPVQVERGITCLTSLMYDGDTSKLSIPEVFRDRAA